MKISKKATYTIEFTEAELSKLIQTIGKTSKEQDEAMYGDDAGVIWCFYDTCRTELCKVDELD